MEDVEDAKGQAAVPHNAAASTLLPPPIANAVSLVTRSSSLYLRLGTFIGGLALDGARVTTLTGLELSRAVIESILHRAGREVSGRSTGELGREEAEGVLERSIATLHSTITSISFAASTGFYISAAALESATDMSQHLLGALDSILGSTDSSRAIASIITLIRREFQDPATGQDGEKVGMSDLLIGICGLALLQRWCNKLIENEVREKKSEEVIWDVVVLDDGSRADVTRKDENFETGLSLTRGNGIVEAVEREGASDSDMDAPEIDLKQRIIQTLPPNASVSISTSITTTKTITVEITGAQPPELTPPEGVEIVEEDMHHAGDEHFDGQVSSMQRSSDSSTPRYRVVYRIVRSKFRRTTIEANDEIEEAVGFADDDGNLESTRSTSLELPASRPISPEQDHVMEIEDDTEAIAPTDHFESSLSEQPTVSRSTENTANQKRSRKPLSSSSSMSGSDNPTTHKTLLASTSSKKPKSDKPVLKPADKKGSFRQAFRKGSTTAISNIFNKDTPGHDPPHRRTQPVKPAQRPPWGVSNASAKHTQATPKKPVALARDAPKPPQRGNPNYFSSRDLGLMVSADNVPRSPSRASYYSIHERRRDSLVSQTDTYSVHSAEARPGSPSAFRTHLRSQSTLLRARSDKNITGQSSGKNHRRRKSYVPSIYTLNTNNSATSLVLAHNPNRSAFDDSTTLETLMRTGYVEGLYPQHHLVRNICRFVRFASASYGASFLRVMGIATSTQHGTTKEIDTQHHHEHHSFSNHTQLPPDTILLSSFVDPQGGTDSTGNTGTGVPMVHFVSLDHESKAVVLTCRGTLGFEDVLTDMTCDYDDIIYGEKAYKVHMGIHASARRLLSSRVLSIIGAALEEFPEYGLVLCGHSLGGGVTALLAIMISEPSPTGAGFITSPASYKPPQLLITSSQDEQGTASLPMSSLPSGRPIHVYAYGPPATLSPSLRLATRGLITTVVHGQDLVPFLSLGTLHDLQAVALAFKNDDSGAKGEVRKRVWEGLRGTFQDKWYQNATTPKDEDDQWAYSALKALRASMLSCKLVPPGEVFGVASMPVLRREAFSTDSSGLGRPATRSVLKYVRDVEKQYGEVRFGGSMLLDHSPGRYEVALGALGKGILEK